MEIGRRSVTIVGTNFTIGRFGALGKSAIKNVSDFEAALTQARSTTQKRRMVEVSRAVRL